MFARLFGKRPDTPASVAAPAVQRAEALLRRLEWTVLRRLDGLLQGDYRTLMRGSGLDLADLREYQLHDDVRHIDWNVTARQQVPHVRVFTEDREMAAWFVLDLSRSVDFGSGTRASRSTVATISPGVQNPHWTAPVVANASCTGWSDPSAPSPSTVTTSCPSACAASTRHAHTSVPSSKIEHEPHSPCSHAFFDPGSPRCSRSA